MVDILLYLGCVPNDWSMARIEKRGGERVQSVKGSQVATKILKHLHHSRSVCAGVGEREGENCINNIMINHAVMISRVYPHLVQ